MSTFRCPRCKAAVERAAVDCASCGKPIAPVPWYLSAWGVGRRAPDAEVLDYARRVTPVLSMVYMALWGVLILAAWASFTMMGTIVEGNQNLERDARKNLEDRGATAEDKEREMLLVSYLLHSQKFARSGCFLVAVLGAAGLGAQVMSFRAHKRLVEVASRAAKSPSEPFDGEGEQDPPPSL